jgi:hypothetical protein
MTMSKPEQSRRALTIKEKQDLARVMETMNASISREIAPALESIETGPGTSIDFDTLARVMVRLRADYLQGDIRDQVAAFEREVVAMELNPSSRDFERVRYALDSLVLFARVFDGREWTPGREDLTPLFELDELTNL